MYLNNLETEDIVDYFEKTLEEIETKFLRGLIAKNEINDLENLFNDLYSKLEETEEEKNDRDEIISELEDNIKELENDKDSLEDDIYEFKTMLGKKKDEITILEKG